MIEEQLETFPGHERFVFALLGAISTLERFRAVLELDDEAPSPAAPNDALLHFALGVVSLSQTVHVVAASEGETGAELGVQDGSEPPEPAPRWLR